MHSLTLSTLVVSSLLSFTAAQQTPGFTSVGNNQFTCFPGGGDFCAADTIIIRCNGTVGVAGNCIDEVAYLPGGYYASCNQTSLTSGDAKCCKGGSCGEGPIFPLSPLPTSATTPTTTSSAATTPSVTPFIDCNPAHQCPAGVSCVPITNGGYSLEYPTTTTTTTAPTSTSTATTTTTYSFVCNPAHHYPSGVSCIYLPNGSLTFIEPTPSPAANTTSGYFANSTSGFLTGATLSTPASSTVTAGPTFLSGTTYSPFAGVSSTMPYLTGATWSGGASASASATMTVAPFKGAAAGKAVVDVVGLGAMAMGAAFFF